MNPNYIGEMTLRNSFPNVWCNVFWDSGLQKADGGGYGRYNSFRAVLPALFWDVDVLQKWEDQVDEMIQ